MGKEGLNLAPAFNRTPQAEAALAYRTAVLEIERLVGDIWRVRLEKPADFTCAAGQYVQIRFPGQVPRPYSLAAGPQRQNLEFHIHYTGGAVGRFVAQTLRVGDSVELSHSQGTPFEADPGKSLLIVAEGMYATPALAILDSELARPDGLPVAFVWTGAPRYLNDMDIKELVQCPDRLMLYPDIHDALEGLQGPARAYLSGSSTMVEAATRTLKNAGFARGHILSGRDALVDSVFSHCPGSPAHNAHRAGAA